MKAKLIFIEVDESRLLRFADKSIILHHEYSYRNRSGRQPIKPVLVGEREIKKSDRIENDKQENPWVVIAEDTESLYPQIASGELVEDVWYEFESEQECDCIGLSFGDCGAGVSCRAVKVLSIPLKVVGEVEQNEPSDTSSEIPNN